MGDRYEGKLSLSGDIVTYSQWRPEQASRGDLVLLCASTKNADSSWAAIGSRLASEGWRVVAPEMRGFDDSNHGSRRISRDRPPRRLAEFIDRLGLDRPVLGGVAEHARVAWAYALAHREGVRALIVCALPSRPSLRRMLHPPVLLMHGGADPDVPVAYAYRAFATLPRGELIVIPEAGRWVQRDAEDEVVDAISDFLNRLPDQASS